MTTIPQDTPQDKPTPKTTFIYALIDPETNEVRYVGKTNNPRKRFNRHLRQNEDSYRQRWIEDLKTRGLIPSLEIIEEVPIESWSERERYWIDFYRSQGCHLTNTALGGKGGNPSPETRAKIAASLTGQTRPPEFHEKMRVASACKKGTKRPPEVGRKISETKTGTKRPPRSEEWQQKLTAAHIGRKNTPETIEKMSLARKRWHAMRKLPPSDAPTLWDHDG